MINRSEIIDTILKKTFSIVENTLGFRLPKDLKNEINKLLNLYYLYEKLTYKELKVNSQLWGMGVWDLLLGYDTNYKCVLVLNYPEYKLGRCSPVYKPFPFEELNNICNDAINNLLLI